MLYAFIIILFYTIALLLFSILPLLGKLFVFVLNFFVPDPLPYIDEVFMIISISNHIETITNIFDKIEHLKYKIKSIFK